MPIATECPSCAYKGQVPDQFKGRKVKCPWCETMFVVGGSGAKPADAGSPKKAPAKAGAAKPAAEQSAEEESDFPAVPKSNPSVEIPPPAKPKVKPKSNPAIELPPAEPATASDDQGSGIRDPKAPGAPDKKAKLKDSQRPVKKTSPAASKKPSPATAKKDDTPRPDDSGSPFGDLSVHADSPAPSAPAERKTKKKGSPFAILCGLLALLFGFIGVSVAVTISDISPLINTICLWICGAGLGLGVLGLLVALIRGSMACPLVGSIVSGGALGVCVAIGHGLIGGLNSVLDGGDKNKEVVAKDGASKDGAARKDGDSKDGPAKDGKDKDGVAKDAAAKDKAKDAAAKDGGKPAPAPPPGDWVDAAKDPAVLGDIRVRVKDVAIDFPRGKKFTDAVRKGRYVQVLLEIENASPKSPATYVGWGSFAPKMGDQLPQLKDEHNKAYPRVKIDPPAEVKGQTGSAAPVRIDPKKAVSDVVLFDKLDDKAQVLLVELPAANVGGKGSFKLKIPRSMVAIKSDPPEEPDQPTPEVPNDPKVIAELQKKLKDPDKNIRAQSAQHLAAIGAKAVVAVPELIAGLKDKDEKVRVICAEALGKIAPKTPQAAASVKALIEALKDEYYGVKVEAAKALSEIGPDAKEALAPLTGLLTDDDKEVARAAERAMNKIKAAPKK